LESQSRDEKPLPIFFDPSRARWPRIRNALLLLTGLLLLLGGALLASVLFPSMLPSLGLRATTVLRSGPRLAPRVQAAAKPVRRSIPVIRRPPRIEPPKTAPASSETIGYFVNWDEASFSSLKANLDAIDLLVPEWLHVYGPDGSLEEDDAESQLAVLEYLRESRPSLRILPLVNNYHGETFDSQNLVRVLGDKKLRTAAIDRMLKYVKDHAFAGLTIDFEGLPDSSRESFHAFLEELGARLHAAKLLLAINVQAEQAGIEFTKVAQLCDRVIVMAFDEHWLNSQAGPLASADWFAEILEQRRKEIPPEKLVWAIGNYGYDWVSGTETASKSFDEVMLTARQNKAQITLDKTSLNPTFTYQDGERKQHTVWFLDAVTAFNQIALARGTPSRGLAVWRLGSEDPSIWTLFAKKRGSTAEAAANLATMAFKYRVNFIGEGEIYRVAASHHDGRRDVTYEPHRGLITDERYQELPSPCMVERYGSTKARKIALTFDDGPDPKYTPFILDILRRKHVPATFFIVGSNGQRFPELIERELADNHEIGNHTYTHPAVFAVSTAQLRLEVSGTERLLQATTDRQAVLFRAPYGSDLDPSVMEDVSPLETVTDMGYISIGWNIDPEDWKQPPADEIVRRVMQDVQKNERHIVLLHDSGGDRSQTVKALPVLIDRLRALHYELVSVSNLMGRSRDDVMPPLSADKEVSATINRQTFHLMYGFSKVLSALFLAGAALGIARLVFIAAAAVIDKRRRRKTTVAPGFLPEVAVIVPAYNEEKVIVNTIASLLASSYRGTMEILVVDDGSRDKTAECARAAFGDEPRVRIFSVPNGGKSAALNFGLRRTSAPIVVGLDADTIFPHETIDRLVRHFADPRVGAVAGNAKVGNRINILTRWQALEYVTSQNLDRRAFNLLNCITVVPGAVGAWRRELVEELGGFTPHTLAEDADLTIAIVKAGYQVLYDEEAVGLTEAPDTVRGLLRQRFRWMFGTAQAAFKHRECLFRPKYRAMGLIGLPNIVLFQVLFPLISPILDVTLAFSIVGWLIRAWQHYNGEVSNSLLETALYYAAFTAADFCTAVLAFRMEPAEDKRLLAWLIPQRLVYRQLMYFVAIRSALAMLRGFEVGWGKLDRKATVTAMPEISASDLSPVLARACEQSLSDGPRLEPDFAERPLDQLVHAPYHEEEPTLSIESD
jgi:cellulose synthase/poly-beta-1,6-N-acetylglucosamine synthase-like glycosyltransferase/peptidoglycan/xylan/chitin deacetylase (PgdA/CDA1 family)/spore germination protein YaaH